MAGVSAEDTSMPSYSLRVTVKFTGFFKREIALAGKNEDAALSEIKKLFDGEESKNELEEYYLVASIWKLPIAKGADMKVEEALLEIERGEDRWSWAARIVGKFIKVSR